MMHYHCSLPSGSKENRPHQLTDHERRRRKKRRMESKRNRQKTGSSSGRRKKITDVIIEMMMSLRVSNVDTIINKNNYQSMSSEQFKVKWKSEKLLVNEQLKVEDKINNHKNRWWWNIVQQLQLVEVKNSHNNNNVYDGNPAKTKDASEQQNMMVCFQW